LLRSLVLLVAVLGLADTAAADAIMPPPDDCPSGEKGISSHSGPQCVKVEPTDCPPGWRGVLGGECMLSPCATDKQCGPSEACIDHSVCLKPSEDGYYDYGEEPPPGEAEETGALPKNYPRELLGGPMQPKVKRNKPIIRYEAVNLCAAEVQCAAPSTCQTEKLCAPKGKRAVAYLGTNISAVRVARQTDTPLTQSEAAATEVASPAVQRVDKGGCAACSIERGGDDAWLLALLALAVASVRRAARRESTRGSGAHLGGGRP
jgi:MYXO-CTERM domain-containing protein